MSHKSARISAILRSFEGRDFDPHYLGFFECFNRQLFFEAHEVLEQLWLPERGKPKDFFYKGLIQLAGAFVHIQKGRRDPALALLELARGNLAKYPSHYQALDISKVQEVIQTWRERLLAHPQEVEPPDAWPVLSFPRSPGLPEEDF